VQLSDTFAAALVALGVEKGERVALHLPNCPQFVIAQLGAWKAGAVVPLNPFYTERGSSGMLADMKDRTSAMARVAMSHLVPVLMQARSRKKPWTLYPSVHRSILPVPPGEFEQQDSREPCR